MKWFSSIGILLQVAGAWFLCRFFYKARALGLGSTESWVTRLRNDAWGRLWVKVGNYILHARGLPWEERREDEPLIADPNATFAFILIAIGTLIQLVVMIVNE